MNGWEKKVAWIGAILVVLICFDVFSRYVFNVSKIWIIELEWHLFGILFLLSAAYTWKHDRHVRVDLFYEKYSEQKKAWINFIGTLIFVVPWCVLVIHCSLDYAINSLSFRESSPNPNGLPARYIIKFAISLSFILLLLQAFSVLIKSYFELAGKNQFE